MSLTNPNTPVSQQDLQDFYHKILPYMGGSSDDGGGHTIEDAEGTALTQRDKLQFGEGLSAQDDSTNEKTVVDIDPMPAEDMDDVIDELPTGGNIAVTGYVPLAMIMQYYGETPPKFFLACDGNTYNKADYPELAKHLLSLTYNTPYIVDGDDTKFKVPDLRGEFLRGAGTNSHANQGSGANVGIHQDATEHPFLFKWTNNNIYCGGKGESVVPSNTDTTTMSTVGRSDVSTTASTTRGEKTYTSRPTNTSVLYCIAYKDIYSNPMNDYSTDEKVVGTWIDGKPIYQKTVDFGKGPNNAEKSVPHGISNLDKTVNISGVYVEGQYSDPLPNAPIDSTGKIYSTNVYMDGTNLHVRSTYDFSNRDFYITIQYTKTTG